MAAHTHSTPIPVVLLTGYHEKVRRHPINIPQPKPMPAVWSLSLLISSTMRICDAYGLPGGSLGDTLQF
jgi:hypothetical protein